MNIIPPENEIKYIREALDQFNNKSVNILSKGHCCLYAGRNCDTLNIGTYLEGVLL